MLSHLRPTILLLILFALPRASQGSFVTHEIQSRAIAGNTMGISSLRRVTVHIPDDYRDVVTRYPVIYFIGGFRRPTDLYIAGFEGAIKAKRLPPAITVLIDASEGILFLNSAEFGQWEDFFIKELIPFVDRTYRTIATPRSRALMGHSNGGLTALLLPVLHPNIWGSIGLNDGSAYYVGYYELHAANVGGIPKALEGDFNIDMEIWKNMPARLEDYNTATSLARMFIQLGVAISPNPAAPLHFDPPVDKEGKPVPEVLEKWRAYCLFDPSTLAKHQATLKALSSIVLIVPELNGATTNAYQNLYWMDLMTAAGISVTRIDWPGGHSDFRMERLVTLEEEVLRAQAR